MADNPYTKLFASMLRSSVWVRSTAETKCLWIAILCLKDSTGFVRDSVPGLAHEAGISLEACEAGLRCLMAPDPYSSTPDYEGRRIVKVEGGWQVVNHEKYQAMGSEYAHAARQKRYRERHAPSRTVTSDVTSDARVTYPDPDPDPNEYKINTVIGPVDMSITASKPTE